MLDINIMYKQIKLEFSNLYSYVYVCVLGKHEMIVVKYVETMKKRQHGTEMVYKPYRSEL